MSNLLQQNRHGIRITSNNHATNHAMYAVYQNGRRIAQVEPDGRGDFLVHWFGSPYRSSGEYDRFSKAEAQQNLRAEALDYIQELDHSQLKEDPEMHTESQA